jgi:predicted DNA-binding transcriptional regulator AlpA
MESIMAARIYLTEREFSERYKVAQRTIQRWRVTGDGPPYIRLGPRRIVYPEEDAEAWAAARKHQHRAAEISSTRT